MDHGFKTKNYTTHKLKCMRKFLDIDYSNVVFFFGGGRDLTLEAQSKNSNRITSC